MTSGSKKSCSREIVGFNPQIVPRFLKWIVLIRLKQIISGNPGTSSLSDLIYDLLRG